MSSVLAQPGTIRDSAKTCAELFFQVIRQSEALDSHQRSLNNEFGRFKLWTANIGVFAELHSSLDFRLREFDDIRDPFLRQLATIETRLLQFGEDVHRVPPQDTTKDEESHPQSSRSSSSSIFQDWNKDQLLQSIHESIDWLHRLSNLVRKASFGNQRKRADGFRLQDSDGNDLTEPLTQYFTALISREFSSLQDSMVQRLAASMVMRRRRIMYRRSQQRHWSLQQQTEYTPKSLDLSSQSLPATVSEPTPPEPEQKISRQDERAVPPATPSRVTATTLDADIHRRRAAQSGISKGSTSPLAKEAKLLVPLPPRAAASGDDFTCHYCCVILSSEVALNHNSWVDHVKKDLDPYVCIVDECDDPLELYSSRKDWLAHMRTRHLMRWHCVAKSHDTPVVFELEETFIEHMKTEHPAKFRDEQLPIIAESSSHPKDPTFDDCPFCTATPPNLEEHVGQHLRDLALRSLPWPEDDEYESQNESCSVNENSSSDEITRDTIRDFTSEFLEISVDDNDNLSDFDAERTSDDDSTEYGAGVRLRSYGYIPKIEDEHRPLDPTEQQTDEVMAVLARHQYPEPARQPPAPWTSLPPIYISTEEVRTRERYDYTTVVAHSNTWTRYECDYLARNLSRVQLEVRKIKKEVLQMRNQPFRSGSVIRLMKIQLENTKVDSIYLDHRRPFVPCNSLYAIMNKATVQWALEELVHDGHLRKDVAEILRLTQTIAPSITELCGMGSRVTQFRRVFAALILMGKAESIFEFIQHDVNDREMYSTAFALQTSGDEELFPLLFQDMAFWARQDIRNFEAIRWELSPVFFGNMPEENDLAKTPRFIPHFELRSSGIILPFLPVRSRPVTHGVYSQLDFYRVHNEQHDLRRYTASKKLHPIAVKRLEDKRTLNEPRDLSQRFEEERYVLQRITLASQSEHLVKLLATFETGGDNCPNKYHFIFEAADGTLTTLWKDNIIWKEADKASLSLWAAKQCYGLAEGLSLFHKFRRLDGDNDLKASGLHGNVKPDNILWYKDWIVNNDGSHVAQDERNETLGILQIAGFGLSRFYSAEEVHNVKIVTSGDYTAPETELWLRHNPLSDVWALGCIFLDFATWLVTGPNGYEAFTHARGSRGALFTKRGRFSTVKQINEDVVEVAVSSKVVEHARQLHQSTRASQFARDLIELVLDHMLIVEPLASMISRQDGPDNKVLRRIPSSEVRDKLKRMLGLYGRDSTYSAASKPETDFNPPSHPSIRLHTTAEKLREDILATHGEVKARLAEEGR